MMGANCGLFGSLLFQQPLLPSLVSSKKMNRQHMKKTMNDISSILDIAKLLKLGEEQCQQKHWKEVSKILQNQEKTAAEYDAKAVVESNFKTKRRIVLQNVIKFVEAFKWRFDEEVIAPISTNEIGLQVAMGCEKNKSPRKIIKTYIDNLLTLRVINLESEMYSYSKSISKLYSFNQIVYSRLLAYANSKYQISTSQSQSLSYHISIGYGDEQEEDTSENAKFDESRIRICKRMKMDVTGISLSRIESVLNARYPQFLEGKKIAAKLNKSLPIEEQIKWQWHLELKQRDGKKYLTKIGFRASNMICSYKNRENKNPCYRGKWRREYLTEVYGSGYSHYDFNASIWRLSYNLLHDEMLSESMDGYELAYGEKFKSDDDRDIFKKIAMRLYFGGINQLGVQVERKFKEIANKLGKKYTYNHARARCIQDIMSDHKLLAVEKIGGFFDSEIFLHESCIYLNIYKDIVDSGIRCTQIYDSFYFNADSNINVNQLYKTHLSQYKLKFAKTFNYLTLEGLSYHISYLCGRKKAKKMVKQDNSDIPDEPEANPLAEKLEKLIDKVVKSSLMGLHTANKISSELHLGRTWTYRDQPTGFCFSNESRQLFKALKQKIPQYKKALRIED